MTTLLIVDDTLLMRQRIRDIANDNDLEVVGEAENGIQAVELYRMLQPDVVLMDITMPLKSGIDATADIISEFPNAVIIMLSALEQQKIIIQALENGAKDFLVKPFEPQQFVRTVRQFI